MSSKYVIGLDYGTNTVRTLIVNTANGREVGTAVWGYEHGTQGVILGRDPNLARQHPADYIKGAEVSIKKALADAKKSTRGFKPEQVIGIGVDTTGSTPLPVGASGQPLAFQGQFGNNPAMVAWQWRRTAEAAGSRCSRQRAAHNGGTTYSESSRPLPTARSSSPGQVPPSFGPRRVCAGRSPEGRRKQSTDDLSVRLKHSPNGRYYLTIIFDRALFRLAWKKVRRVLFATVALVSISHLKQLL